MKVKKIERTFVNKEGEKVDFAKYYLIIDGIDVNIKLDETGKQLIDKYISSQK